MAAIISIMEIEKTIRKYRQIAAEIEELRKKGFIPDRGQPAKHDDIFQAEAARRGMSRIDRLMHRARFVESRIELITDDRERTVLDCILDGMTHDAIAVHLGLGKTTIVRMKESVLKQLYDSQFEVVRADEPNFLT